jgi:putative ABC transport system permease protein
MMSAIWIRAKSELRARWRPWLAVAIMIGIASGVVMEAAAGARRSDTAVSRFLAYSHASHADVEADPSTFHAIAALPEVESAEAAAFMLMGKASADSVDTRFSLTVLSLTDPTLVGPPSIIVAGRMFDVANPSEAVINQTALRDGALKIGQRVTLRGFTFDQLQDVLRGSTANPKGPSATVTIVGAVKVPTDLSTTDPPPGVLYTGNNVIVLTPALYAKIGGATANFSSVAVELRRGEAGIPQLAKDVARLTRGKGKVHGGSDDLQAGVEAQKATHTEALALWLFAGLASAAAILIVGQSVSRQLFFAADDRIALLALGMTRGQSTVVGMIQVAAATILGAAIGVATAIGLSPLAPIGLAREAEVDLGFHLDTLVVVLGALACVALVIVRAIFPAWRASGRSGRGESTRHPSRTAGAFARAGMPASSVAGVQMALDPGRGRNAVPVRTAIAGSVVAIAVLISALAFGTSLRNLADSPRQQGWTWDFAVGNPHSDDVTARAIPLLRQNPYVAGFSAEMYGEVAFDGRHKVNALGLDTIVGDVSPPMLEGRQPQSANEIALGTKSFRALHKRVGDTVRVSGADGKGSRSMRIVGRALITPIIVNGTLTLGDGAVIPLETMKTFVTSEGSDQGTVNVFLVALKRDADRAAAAASLRRDFPGTVLTPYAPAEVENLRRIDSLPFALAGLLGLLAVVTIAHALVTSVRRRRRDLAVLKTLGFVRGQVSATVSWQASTLIALAAAMGLVGGVAMGRWLWVWYATRLGIRPEPAIPALVLGAIIPAAILLANVVAITPARSAGRTKPALVLRTE